MSHLKAGLARVNITPMMGVNLRGYFHERLCNGVLDELEINALALENDGKQAILISVDNIGMTRETAFAFKENISKTTGVPLEGIYIHGTHTHTGPSINIATEVELEKEYYQFVYRRMGDVAKFAMDDLKEAKMGYGMGVAPEIAFIRRYKMKDGTTQTNPARNDPNIDHAIGEPDKRVNVLRFDREGGDHIVLVNYGNHPDVIGGHKVSGDWPSHIRKEVEKIIDRSRCIFFNGCQGDVNHIDFFPTRTEKDFMSDSGKYGGYEHSKYMGRALAGTVAQVYDKVQAMEDTEIRVFQKDIKVPSNMPAPEDLPEAHRIYDIWKAGRASELPYEGMMRTTVIARANRMVTLENGPEYFDMQVSAVAIGKVVLVGMPGEAFTGIGVALKDTEGWDLILPTCLTNGSHGYFPMQEAYDEGGYEANNSRFKPGVAERLIAAGKEVMAAIAK